MSITGDPHGAQPQGVSPFLSLVIGFVSFAAFSILGLGMLSFFTDADILAVPGLDWWPGIVAMLAAVIAFAWMLWPPVSRERASLLSAVAVAAVAVFTHLVVVWLAALLSGVGLGSAFSAVSQLITHGSSVVVFAAGLLGAWTALALRRTRGGTPRWPWETDEAE